MNTEITDEVKVNGWVLYDADCRFCARLAGRFRPWLGRRHLELLPLQTPWVRARLGLADARLLAEMRLLLPNGTHFGGADALIEIGRRYGWAWPLGQMTRVPAMRELVRRSYRWLARRRNCGKGGSDFTNRQQQTNQAQTAKHSKVRSGKRTVFFEMP
ncbi:MAG TPA: DCC1-like thiol-disulfide oxidoreductase family protein [Verrucomicrobiae bacterium]|nr:DCC1-like thiol-disulfide oxidoreductase family protein [Verrucomicrobiae bacterium]